MSEEINRVKVFQDVVGEWWLEFYANDIRHQVTIQDVINGLASWINMQATNAVLHERIDDLESAQQSRAADSSSAEQIDENPYQSYGRYKAGL